MLHRLAIMIVCLFGMPLLAKKTTLELGLGVAGLSYPSYLGASKQKYLAIVVPYIQYRGEMFQVDESGVKKELLDIAGLNLDVSVSGALPVDSGSSRLREGMDDLDFVFEVGPKVTYRVWDDGLYYLRFRLPLRAVLSTDFERSMVYRGILALPQFKISQERGEREMYLVSGVALATSRYHDYFYGVDERFATLDRSAYEAKGGYGGFRNKVGFSDKKGAWVYDAYVVHYLLDGATFENSPLLEQKNGLFVQASISYIFYAK